MVGIHKLFLIVSVFITWAKKQYIHWTVGVQRFNSSMGMNITDIESVNMVCFLKVFKSFKISLPDFDIDFRNIGEEVIDYVKNKYGKDKVAQIITFGSLQARAV